MKRIIRALLNHNSIVVRFIFVSMLIVSFACMVSISIISVGGVILNSDEVAHAKSRIKQVIGAGGINFPGQGGSADPCSCAGSTYMFCYTSKYSGDDAKACFTNGTLTKDGSENGGILVDEFGVTHDAANKYITWVVAGGDGINGSVAGTLYVSLYLVDEGNADVDTNDFFEASGDANNRIKIYTHDGSNSVYGYFRSQGNTQDLGAGIALSFETWYRVGYSWEPGADAAGKHSISVVTLGNDQNFATEHTEDLDTMTTAIDDVTMGENEAGTGMTDTVWTRDLIILSGYQTDDPLQ